VREDSAGIKTPEDPKTSGEAIWRLKETVKHPRIHGTIARSWRSS